MHPIRRRLTLLASGLAVAACLALAAVSAAPADNLAGLNPQPLPPRDDLTALNPQPLPPRDDLAALNPQPLPPRWG